MASPNNHESAPVDESWTVLDAVSEVSSGSKSPAYIRLEAIAKAAELKARAVHFKKRRQLEEEELLFLQRKRIEEEQLRWKREQLSIETEIAVAEARLQVLEVPEQQDFTMRRFLQSEDETKSVSTESQSTVYQEVSQQQSPGGGEVRGGMLQKYGARHQTHSTVDPTIDHGGSQKYGARHQTCSTKDSGESQKYSQRQTPSTADGESMSNKYGARHQTHSTIVGGVSQKYGAQQQTQIVAHGGGVINNGMSQNYGERYQTDITVDSGTSKKYVARHQTHSTIDSGGEADDGTSKGYGARHHTDLHFDGGDETVGGTPQKYSAWHQTQGDDEADVGVSTNKYDAQHQRRSTVDYDDVDEVSGVASPKYDARHQREFQLDGVDKLDGDVSTRKYGARHQTDWHFNSGDKLDGGMSQKYSARQQTHTTLDGGGVADYHTSQRYGARHQTARRDDGDVVEVVDGVSIQTYGAQHRMKLLSTTHGGVDVDGCNQGVSQKYGARHQTLLQTSSTVDDDGHVENRESHQSQFNAAHEPRSRSMVGHNSQRHLQTQFYGAPQEPQFYSEPRKLQSYRMADSLTNQESHPSQFNGAQHKPQSVGIAGNNGQMRQEPQFYSEQHKLQSHRMADSISNQEIHQSQFNSARHKPQSGSMAGNNGQKRQETELYSAPQEPQFYSEQLDQESHPSQLNGARHKPQVGTMAGNNGQMHQQIQFYGAPHEPEVYNEQNKLQVHHMAGSFSNQESQQSHFNGTGHKPQSGTMAGNNGQKCLQAQFYGAPREPRLESILDNHSFRQDGTRSQIYGKPCEPQFQAAINNQEPHTRFTVKQYQDGGTTDKYRYGSNHAEVNGHLDSSTNRNPQQNLDPKVHEHTGIQNARNSDVADIVRQQGSLTQLLLEHHLKASLPQRSLQPFTGDPLKYATFMKAFEYTIEQRVSTNQDRLYYLEQFTQGEPNKLVRSCFHLKSENAYEETKGLLERKFGSKHRIAEAYITKLNQWTSVKSDSSLHDFSLFLIECQNTMDSMGYVAELDSTATIRMIVSKLPYGLRDRWRRVADNIEEERHKTVRFNDLIQFIERQARIVTNPAYGSIQSQRDDDPKKKPQPRGSKPVRSYSVATKQEPKKSCSFCKGTSHNLETCYKLENKPIGERLKYLRSQQLCFGCLKKATHLCKDCIKKLVCNKCKKRHPTVLHTPQNVGDSKSEEPKKQKQAPQDSKDHSTMCGLTGAGVQESSPIIIPVVLHSRATGTSVETYAFLDDGSDAIFCTEKIMKQLHVKGRTTNLEIQTINETKEVSSHEIQGLEVSDMDKHHFLELGKVYTQQSVPAKIEDIVTYDDIKAWPYMQRVELNRPPRGSDVHIGMLIGNTLPQATEPWDVINSRDGGPYACKTLLGWSVHGIKRPNSPSLPRISVNRIHVQESVEQQMMKLFNHDFNERIIEDQPEKSIEDRQFLADVAQTVQHKDGHYEIGLPLKDKNLTVPDNKLQAVQRAAGLKRKFLKNPVFYQEYKSSMEDYIDKGYASKIPEEELHSAEGRRWYIPHHGVYHPKKNKLRVVFDCAASNRGFSLNNNLLQGPDLTNSLVGVLMRFRQEQIALVSDIQAMYHQVRIPQKDQDLQRFLWWKDGNLEEQPEEYRMGVHIFGATSSPACATYALQRTVKDTKQCYNEQVANTMQRSFYVDDCLTSVKKESEAVVLAENLRKLCQEGGFRLTKWWSNSRAVLQSIPESERAKEVAVLDLETESLPSERVLGMLWSPDSDQFGFQIEVKDRPPTRRGILSVVSSIYDPLGFICPATLTAKQIMQDLCKLKIGWDEEIPITHLRKWQQWTKTLPELETLNVDRCYKPPDFGKVKSTQLHHFSDASQKGYGTVSYLRSENESGDIHCAFIMGKARVAPVKQITVPRLELTAASIAVRVNAMIHRELEIPIDDTVYWTDSMSVLRYINNATARFQTFVANRIAVISDGSNSSQWRYVPTNDNPADDCSRGLAVDKFLFCERWIKGPEFLHKPEVEWPVQQHINPDILPDDAEVKKVKANVLLVDQNSENDQIDMLLKHYSSWYRLKKAVAWILRVRKHLLHKVRGKKQVRDNSNQPETSQDISTPTSNDKNESHSSIKRLGLTDMQEAEDAVVQYVQRRSFPQEIAILKDTTPITDNKRGPNHLQPKIKKTSSIFKLNPFMSNGIIRVGGRLAKAAMPEEEKFPVILPKDTHITNLILREIHEMTGHGGRNHMLSHLHRKFWVVKANSAARKVIGKCVRCRKQKAKVAEQQMADLPKARVSPEEAPFTRVGIDYFGPIEVKRGRSIVKRYGVVFTCLAVRAIHIEKADTLETDSCICAIRRFVARRGQVKEVWSDNGTNLVGAKKELQEHINKWNQTQIHNALLHDNLEWNFNPPTGSHFGGIWERQIRTVRKIAMAILKQQLMTDECLQTLFCEIESIINSRPITRVSGDLGDLEALTPNHLLLLKVKPALPPALTGETGPYARKRWKQIQYMADLFWKRWTEEYVRQLQERQKWVHPKANLQKDDIVLIVDNSRPRNAWQMGRILDTIPDKKGFVRQVKLKTKTATLVRPISKLCVLLEADE